jgi:hypothetical protein
MHTILPHHEILLNSLNKWNTSGLCLINLTGTRTRTKIGHEDNCVSSFSLEQKYQGRLYKYRPDVLLNFSKLSSKQITLVTKSWCSVRPKFLIRSRVSYPHMKESKPGCYNFTTFSSLKPTLCTLWEVMENRLVLVSGGAHEHALLSSSAVVL